MEIILGFGLFFIIENIVYIRWWLKLFRLIELVILWLVCKLGLIMIRLISDLEFVVIFVGCLIIFEYLKLLSIFCNFLLDRIVFVYYY